MTRDLKPENILMDEAGYLRLSDFGLSKQAETSKTFCGTADYLAPEMIAGRRALSQATSTTRTWTGGCWYAGLTQGVLLYEMVAGTTPFAAQDHMQTYRKIQEVAGPHAEGAGHEAVLQR